jgi:NitT/TauT family transport system permease protein
LAAVVLVLTAWQLVVWSGWKPKYVLPWPSEVFQTLLEDLGTASFWQAVGITMQRAAIGFAAAVVVGTVVGLVVAQSSILRRAVGSLITGLQSMPSIVWFPFAILLFQISETAIFFVVVLGAAPAIANGLISGIDHIEPILLRAGKVLGARGPMAWRHVVLPAALPGYVAGLKQGWAFAWRSLMAGELLVIIASQPSIGVRLSFARELADAAGLQAMMIVVLVIGIVVDGVFFGTIERRVRRNRGLLVP